VTAFATADDFEVRIGLTLDDDEKNRVDALLGMAADLIRNAARQEISLVENDVLTMPGTNADRIALPERPVVSVASVTLDDLELTEGSIWWLDGDTIVRLGWPRPGYGYPVVVGGNVFTFGRGFGWPKQTLAITYTHGYADDDLPGLVKTISLEAVTRVWVNPGAVARETVGDTSTVYDNMRFSPTGLLLTKDEIRSIRRLFGYRAASVSLG
jgi:hypothetical protein